MKIRLSLDIKCDMNMTAMTCLIQLVCVKCKTINKPIYGVDMVNIMSPECNYGFYCMSGLQKLSVSLITYSQLCTPRLFFLFSSYSFFIPPHSGYILSGPHMPSGKYSPNSICMYKLHKPQLKPSKVK